MSEIKLLQGDCLELMKNIPDKSIDMILCDLPFGVTQNSWDTKIDFDALWGGYKRICKDNAAIVLNCQQPFTSELIMSNREMFKYCWVWEKSKATNFLNVKRQPLRKTEDICVFYQKQPTYNPQMTIGKPYDKGVRKDQLTGSYGDFSPVHVQSDGERYPTNIIYFKTAESEGKVFHPTQKPIALCEYLIKTYTNEGDTILDNCMGSGSTGVASVNLNRNFIGMELDEKYFEIAKERIENVITEVNQINNNIKE